MEKRANFDIEMELFRNLITESKSWIVDQEQNSLIKETEHRILYKLWNKSSRNTSIRPRFEQEKEITRNLETQKIVTPRNDDRFDKWGG